MFLAATVAQAQKISIGGNVYGGGNLGNMTGNTSVTVRAGDFHEVYGGARMANVGGGTFVNIDGEKASDFIIIDKVYGGNDIAGTIGANAATKAADWAILSKLTHKNDLEFRDNLGNIVAEKDTNKVNKTWDAIIRLSTKTTTVGTGENEKVVEAEGAKKIYIGQLFGGGNGDYDYTSKIELVTEKDPETGDPIQTQVETNPYFGLTKPVLNKAYLEICGGSIVYAYGGGNAATVKKNTIICVDNPSQVVNHIKVNKTTGVLVADDATGNNIKELLDDARFERMGIYGSHQGFVKPSSDEFQIGRLFGGNNKAVMAIMPKWNLLSGKVRNLYSGGNEGHMTYDKGLLLEIRQGSTIVVDNLFGGCRKADVRPLNEDGTEVATVYGNIGNYNFPPDLAARVIVNGGDVNNVYGGNDISGKVHFGSALGIYADVRGNVYGGGNGNYAYTDNSDLKNDPTWKDFYYDPAEVFNNNPDETPTSDELKSVEALNLFRPNAEQVSIRIAGTSEASPTVIGGSVYVGGNCATLKAKKGYEDPLAELKIGSYILVDKVFLGNNGESMVDASPNGVLATYAGTAAEVPNDFTQMDLTDDEVFKTYMDGVTMEIEPKVKFDNFERDSKPDYVQYSASIGSFYCGGNVGSMRSEKGVTNLTFDHKVIIFDKLVGGCNNANVPEQWTGPNNTGTQLNAAYQGGLIGDKDKKGNALVDGNKLILNLSGLKIQPKRWKVERDKDYKIVYRDANNNVTDQANGTVTYILNNGKRQLEWNTVDNSVYDTDTKTFKEVPPITSFPTGATVPVNSGEVDGVKDIDRRLFGGNIYGGCYNSGIVEGNVVININSTIVDREDEDPNDDKDYGVFDSVVGDSEGEAILYASDQYKITKRRSGVILDEQGMDVLGQSLNVFGGGHGKDTEIWGSTTINLNAGYTFQIFGGSEEGIIGKPIDESTATDGTFVEGTYTFNHKALSYDPKYSCYINVKGTKAGVSKQEDSKPDMAEAEFIYGGGFFGPIAGNTVINLGKGRVFNTFAGSCNADILGHTETYIGRMPKDDYRNNFPTMVKAIEEKTVTEATVYVEGFPWIRDIVYGGNDLGGKILGSRIFEDRVSDFAKTKMYTPSVPVGSSATKAPELTRANAYVEYLQGRADAIFGGCYGTYDYTKPKFKLYTYTTDDAVADIPEGYELGDPREGVYFTKPRMNNAFVNFRPAYVQPKNMVKKVYGAGQGQEGEKERDILQNRSYVLIDIPTEINDMAYYNDLEVFGAGAWGGVGMDFSPAAAKANPDSTSAVIDLMRGTISAAYGGSFKEGITRRTVVNVPAASTINIANIFGGGYGYMEEQKDNSGNITYIPHNEVPCDVYEANVNFSSEDAYVTGGIYGGNNACRRTVFGRVNINSTVHSNPQNLDYQADVYGAGYGKDSWSHYTEVNLNRNAKVYYVYGGGNAGKVLNAASLTKRKTTETTLFTDMGKYNDLLIPSKDTNPMIDAAEYDDNYYNTNVHVKEGSTITGYGFGGGYGAEAVVSGTTYFDILGGTAEKDISGSGRSGDVKDLYGVGAYRAPVGTTDPGNPDGFTVSTMVYVRGGTARNVYASGYRGGIGRHDGEVLASAEGDILGVGNVVIGKVDGTNYINGIPAITRNVYGGGEGGSVFGTTNVTINNGYIGYRYEGTNQNVFNASDYKEELVDGDQSLEKGGNVFGGGYVANSYVDRSVITMYGGQVRGSLFGGGEIGPIGRGTVKATTATGYFPNAEAKIFKGGETHVYLYGGHVMRNVFGGGRGYDNWGGNGTKFMTTAEIEAADLISKGYVFGSTDVHIRGGEVGTADNALRGYGNVFGGGDEGFVYSATGTKESDGYYKKGSDMTLDCNIVVQPYCQVLSGSTVSFDKYDVDDEGNIKIATSGDNIGLPSKVGGTITFEAGDYVPTEYLLQLKNKSADANETSGAKKWAKLNVEGITIHNAVFAGGNITTGSDIVAAETPTVFGNAAASLRDVFNRDLISVGTDDIGGLYGDGNLTLVDGFRELHIDNYGTDFYSLSDHVSDIVYEQMSPREKDYYQLKYVCLTTHDYNYYVSQSLHEYNGTAYKKGQKLSRPSDTFNDFSETEKQNWNEGTKTYMVDDQIEDSEWALMDPAEQAKWRQDGVFSKYAGRPLNTIQRADMCGVYGSRIVLKGAQDRASEEVDYNDYTINRVNEVSLNQRITLAATIPSNLEELTEDQKNEYLHGNYFGIYNTVKFLGNLTSDVHFTDKRRTSVESGSSAPQADGRTYYQFKSADPNSRYRNNGLSYNKVALASGVYLEIKREEGEKTKTDEWGYITGVVELDLLNVMPGMGGGYVYAKNEHGDPSTQTTGKLTVLDYNLDAATYRRFKYTQKSQNNNFQTSGNFVHNTKQIIDDCYPNSGMFNSPYTSSPAHYWFIRGTIYVYDQYISAYTGVANAYAKKVELPLTISAASNGRMTLREVQPNYYAYYDKDGIKLGTQSEKFIVNNKTYYLNDPISYWDYRLLSDADKEKFVEETYVTVAECTIGTTTYPAGYTLLPGSASQSGTEADRTYYYLRQNAPLGKLKETDTDQVRYVLDEDGNRVAFDDIFRPSNNLSHDEGFILTYDVNNPMVWDNYYTKIANRRDKINTKEYTDKKRIVIVDGQETEQTITQGDYYEGPTYSLKAGVSGGVFGQKPYSTGDLLSYAVKKNYDDNIAGSSGLSGQALVEEARIVTSEVSIMDEDDPETEVNRLYPGVTISRNSKYGAAQANYTDAQWAEIVAHSEPAKICTNLLKFSNTDYIYVGQPLSSDDIKELKKKVKAEPEHSEWNDEQIEDYLDGYMSAAYLCYQGGLYGGKQFVQGQTYRAIETWCDLSEEERESFTFNYDAFDLLIDPTYSGRLEENYGKPKIQYDGYQFGTTNNTPLHEGDTPLDPTLYSVTKPVDYQAEFYGYNEEGTENLVTSISYTNKAGVTHTITASADPEDWKSREEYEAIPNERHHFSPIDVKEPRDYYVVKKPFMRGDVPYSVGQVIDPSTYESLNDQQKADVDVFEFTEDLTNYTEKLVNGETVREYQSVQYYYCRDSYVVNEKGEGKAFSTTAIKKNNLRVSSANYNKESTVPQGVIITQSVYNTLPNKQKGFIIHGMSPTEVSTLYVSRESDIKDLSKEKIITVIYLYEYEESDETGQNVTPVSERHIVNIHINFESGMPQVGELHKPDIVLPGTTLALEVPNVDEGAYRVRDTGWELFYQQSDADTHTNGIPYQNNVTPVYWYNNNYWIAYYAKTDLGKTYSNAVQISVANAQDLKAVMNDKEHHYYIDHKDVDYAPKIYINDYSEDATPQNGVQLLKDLYDLSLLDKDHVTTDQETELISEGTFVGHGLLNERVKEGEGLEFILRADLDGSSVTSPEGDKGLIAGGTANGDPCFEGNFHGDGHYISGLTKSLFGKLCGNVYNLGVTGTFTGAGIAETGSGYVENCWISTSSTAAKTTQPVFGSPNRSSGRLVQVVNSYYKENYSDAYVKDGENVVAKTGSYTKQIADNNVITHGTPIRKDAQSFYNGEVAYDLNGFYLFKRYADGSNQTTGLEHQYYTLGDVTDPSKTTSTEPRSAKYGAADASLSSSGVDGVYKNHGYVEERFADGDFRYADCKTIPKVDNKRAFKYTEGTIEKTIHYPVWPDDYIFFGQRLNYGHVEGKTHQDVPSSIIRNVDSYVETNNGNRVYRAPAYFRSKEMKTAYFNPNAVFAQTKKGNDNVIAYKNMTAIDFTDAKFGFGENDTYKVYDKGQKDVTFDGKTTQVFYPPLLDDDGLTTFQNIDLTANLLVYTGVPSADAESAATAAQKTAFVVSQYLSDEPYQETPSAPIFNDNTDLNADPYRYHTVDEYDYRSNALRGHWVQKTSAGYMATLDHLLIDHQDFNAPISYTFGSDYRMWYQREPNHFVDRTMGWEAVSLPFSAELVTTHQKGEITHFFSGSQTSKNGTDSKIGHEYWLREFDETAGTLKQKTASILEGNFKFPSGTDNSENPSDIILKKYYKNTFLWDYYYKAVNGHNQKDMNKDTYQNYYSVIHEYTKYPMLTKGKPYIIGLPGPTYYEFDLSGVFNPTTTAEPYPGDLDKQILTFASQKGTTIQVSDDETVGVVNTYDNVKYIFKPSYLNESFKAGSNIYTLKSEYDSDGVDGADCSSFVKVPNAPGEGEDPVRDTEVSAFRPYFMSQPVTSARPVTRAIVFGNEESELKGVDEHGDLDSDDLGNLRIYAKKHKIVVESALTRDIDIRIVNAAGITLSTFTLEPGETVETRINSEGVYIVQSTDSRYLKKLVVK